MSFFVGNAQSEDREISRRFVGCNDRRFSTSLRFELSLLDRQLASPQLWMQILSVGSEMFVLCHSLFE